MAAGDEIPAHIKQFIRDFSNSGCAGVMKYTFEESNCVNDGHKVRFWFEVNTHHMRIETNMDTILGQS